MRYRCNLHILPVSWYNYCICLVVPHVFSSVSRSTFDYMLSNVIQTSIHFNKNFIFVQIIIINVLMLNILKSRGKITDLITTSH